jgi:hypothetical protein
MAFRLRTPVAGERQQQDPTTEGTEFHRGAPQRVAATKILDFRDLQPALGSRDPRRFDAIRRAQFADCFREIIPHGPFG